MSDLVIRRFDQPDESTSMSRGRLDLHRVSGLTLGRAVYEPGWKWSVDVGAASGEAWCMVSHVGMVLRGQNIVTMQDGRTVTLRPGDVFVIGPGHDSEVLGEEPYESLHLAGAEHYAKGAGTA